MRAAVLLMTDVVGSTRLWSAEHDAMNLAMSRHHEIVHSLVAARGGSRTVDQGEGDSVFAHFTSGVAAVACAAEVHRGLAAESWPTSEPLTVRIALHVGEVEDRSGNLFGDAVNRCARLRRLASGGQTLLSSALYELVRERLPDGLGLTDLGEYRMKDLSRPERVWQLTGPGLDGPFPPLASLDVVRHNLPVQTSSFIGREADLARLVASVRENRLVTLTGFGGMGKTRLALQAAAELTGAPGIGDVWFVDLAAVTDPELVPARVAEVLGLRWGLGDPAAALVEALREKPTLLVLDNLEQVLGCARFVAELLERTPALRVLCTSREPLRVRGEQQIPLPPLALPGPGAVDGEGLSTFEAVRLFVERAVEVRPGFVVDNTTAPSVAAICARLDGHPLALELAAARLKVLSVDKLLDRLDAALSLLTGGPRDMPERHQTLRATIAWSFDALSREEQLLLTRMVALPAPAALELVEEVCGEGLDVLDLLEQLVNKSLVVTSERDGQTRFGLLVSIRQYAAEQIDATALHHLAERHARAVHAPLRVHAVGEEYSRKHAYVDAELAHIRAALAHRRSSGPATEFARLVADLEDTFVHRGLLAENIDLNTAALPAARAVDPPDPELLARVLTSLLFAQSAFPVPVGALAREAVAVARTCTDPVVRAEVLSMTVGDAARDAADVEALLAELDEAITASAGRDKPRQQERHNIAAIMLRYVDPVEAERNARAMTGGHLVGRCARTADLLLDRGEWEQAIATLADASDRSFTGLPNPRLAALIAVRRATALTGCGRLDEARAQLEEAASNERLGGLPPLVSAAGLADLERAAGQLTLAAAALERALHGLDDEAMRTRSVLPLRWRRAVCQRELGEDSAAELRAARDDLVASPLYGPRELLGALVERAVQVVDSDPQLAAEIIATVQAHRGRWVLPFGMDHDLQALLPRPPASAGTPAAPTEIW